MRIENSYQAPECCEFVLVTESAVLYSGSNTENFVVGDVEEL